MFHINPLEILGKIYIIDTYKDLDTLTLVT